MKSPRRMIASTALAATAVTVAAAAQASAVGRSAQASALGRPSGPATAATTTLSDSVAPFATAGHAQGAVAPSTKLTVQFWLAPRTAAAARFANAVSTPGNPMFRHFLSPAAYRDRFGAGQGKATAVRTWLKSRGFAGITTDPGRDYVRATAPAATIGSALKVQLNYYEPTAAANAGRFRLRANDRPVSLPASLASDVIGVTGLDNAAPVMTYAKAGDNAAMARPTAPKGPAPKAPGPKGRAPSFGCSRWYAQHRVSGLPSQFGVTSFPSEICGYSPQQLRKAYGYSGSNVGKGVTVALVEDGLTKYMLRTLQTYSRVHRIQAPSSRRYAELSLGNGPACGDPFNTEEQLDVESAYALAPMASQLVVGGDSCNNGDYGLQALYDADLAILNGANGKPLAQVASNSWEGGNETIPASLLTIEHNYLIKAAAEGVTMLFSSGDSSGVGVPSSDPYATSVGGTTLAIGHDNPRIFETGWSTGISEDDHGKWAAQGEQGAAAGGASQLWAQPSYQRGVVPDSMAKATGDRSGLVRAVPDVSAVADPFTPMAVGMLTYNGKGDVTGYAEQAIGGTSLATPLVAGVLADAEQGSRALGFVNPLLYKLAKDQPDAYHDTTPLTARSSASYRGVACDAATCGALSLTTFDDQSQGMAGYTGQVTAPGYDTMTGIGTPDGQKFISALRAG